MKALVQRVRGKTAIRSEMNGIIEEHAFSGPGLVVLLGWERRDDESSLVEKEEWIRSRVLGLRIFPDDQGRMNLNLKNYSDAQHQTGTILWVSQFTLAASLSSGFRPSFTDAMDPATAQNRWEKFKEDLSLAGASSGLRHVFGVFGANMELSFTNWGPVTIPLDV